MSWTLIVVLLLLAASILAASIKIVPPGTSRTVERMGRHYRTIGPGWHVIVPFIDSIHERRPGDGPADVT